MRLTAVKDARVRKTRSRLHDALVSLIHEQSYQSIVVSDILERADVGRSAFYSHFRNKDALLTSGIEQILHATPPRQLPAPVGPFGKALWFSLPFFVYVGECRGSSRPRMGRKGRAVIHAHLRRLLAEQIREDVRAAVQTSKSPAASIPIDLLVEFIVGTFIQVLTWWVESESSLAPHEADALFLGLVLPALSAAHGDRA